MTLFDYIAGGVLLFSGLVGLVRGATRELTTVIAFVLAAVVAVFALRFTGPIAGHAIHTAWMANAAAILIVFVLAYIVLRMIGGALTRGVQRTALSDLDRALGFGIGLLRGLVVVGVGTLLIDGATPPERMPAWITSARVYPLAQAAGAAVRAFAPQGLKVAHQVVPAMTEAVTGKAPAVASDGPPARFHSQPRGAGYSGGQRGALDVQVEKSR